MTRKTKLTTATIPPELMQFMTGNEAMLVLRSEPALAKGQKTKWSLTVYLVDGTEEDEMEYVPEGESIQDVLDKMEAKLEVGYDPDQHYADWFNL